MKAWMVKSSFIKILSYLFLSHLFIPLLWSQPMAKSDSLFLSIHNLPLKTVLDSLIHSYDMKILYQDRHVDGWAVSLDCKPCSKDESIDFLLKGTKLIWKRNNNQYAISKRWFSQVGRTLSGIVRDAQTGEPLPYVNVFIQNSYLGTITNRDGYFSIAGVPLKSMQLQAAHVGYVPETQDLTNYSRSESIVIRLKSTILVGQQINVIGEPDNLLETESTGQISISPRFISQLPGFGQKDVMRSIQSLPGINMGKMGNAGLFIRGGTPDQNLIIFDGITLYHVDHMFGFFSAFNPAAIKNIQLYKGGFPAKYGGRLSGVLDLSGKNGSSTERGISMSTNLLSSGLSLETPLFNGKGNLFFSARRSHIDYVKTPLYDMIFSYITGNDFGGISADIARVDSTTLTKKDPQFFFFDLNTKLTYMPTAKDVISYSLYRGQDNYSHTLDETSIGLDINTRFQLKLDDQNAWENWGQSIRWARQWDSGIYSNLFFAQSIYKTNYASVSSLSGPWENPFSYSIVEENNVEDLTIRFETEYAYSSDHTLDFGFGFSQFDTEYISEFEDTVSIVLSSKKAQQYFGYFQDKWSPNSRWLLTTGLRTNYFKNTSQFYFEPRFSSRYTVNSHLTLNGSIGTYYQFVNRFFNENSLNGANDFWIVADRNLPPGKANHFLFGFLYKTGLFDLEVEGYFKNMENLVEFERFTLPSEQHPFQTGTGTATGFEVFLKKNMRNFKSWISYTYGKVEYQFDEINSGNYYLADHDRTHQVKWINFVTLGKWHISNSWIYSSGHVYTPLDAFEATNDVDGIVYYRIQSGRKNSKRLPYIHQLNVSSNRRIQLGSNECEIGFGIINLYNFRGTSYRRHRYWEFPIRATDIKTIPFTPTLSIQVNF